MNIQQIVSSGLQDIIMTLISVLIAAGGYYLKQHFTGKQIATAAEIASEAVRFVAQTTAKLPAQDATKAKYALAKAKELAAKVGINLTDGQWETLLESAYKKTKDELSQLIGTDTPYTEQRIEDMITAKVQKISPDNAGIADIVRQEMGKYIVMPQSAKPAPVAKDPVPETDQTS